MNKKIVTRLIILVVILIIVICVGLLILNTKNDKTNKEDTSIISNSEIEEFVNEQKIEEVTRTTESYNITKMINQYYDVIDKSRYYTSDGEDMSGEEEVRTSIYHLLSEEYIKQNHITIENVYQHVDDITTNVYFIPLKIKRLEGWGVNKYLVYGKLIDMSANNKEAKDTYLYLNQDIRNKTFSIEPINEKNMDIEKISYTNTIEKIEENENNKMSNDKLTEEKMLSEKFNNFKLLNVNDSKFVYDNYINEEYKNKKFKTYQAYQAYLQDNKERFSTMAVDKYKITGYDGYTEYAFLDKNNNYYIFQEKSIFDYNVVFDTYTIDLPEFTQKYASAKEQNKAVMNAEKFFQAINSKDYTYAYNVLADSFKKNQYKTQADFERYAQEAFFEKNYITYSNYKKEENLGVLTIKIRDSEDINANEKNMTIIMQLKEGTDFAMSFSME